MTTIIGLVIAYLIGSISTSILVAKIKKLPDPRTKGSGNAGATNMLRLAGKQEAILVLIGDALKGFIAVMIGHLIGDRGIGLALVGFAAVVGHVFPVFFKFKGGKGVATMMGALLALHFWVGIAAIVAWIVIAVITRYASFASIVAAVIGAVCTLVFGVAHYFIPVLFMAILIIWKHMENIERLRKGTESKIDLKL